MNNTTLILSALMMLSLTIFLAPGVLAMNRGKILQNVALWLAIFLGLALLYKNFGPESPHPLFGAPEKIQEEQTTPETPKQSADEKSPNI